MRGARYKIEKQAHKPYVLDLGPWTFDLGSVKSAGLTQRFVENDAGGRRQIEAANQRREDRDPDAKVGMVVEQFVRQSLGFLAEDKKVTSPEVRLDVGFSGFFRGVPVTGVRVCGLQFRQRLPLMNLDGRPVVETGSFEVTIVQGEAESTDQVQNGSGSAAEPGNVAGIGRDFRFNQDDVKWDWFAHHFTGLSRQRRCTQNHWCGALRTAASMRAVRSAVCSTTLSGSGSLAKRIGGSQ